MNQRQNMARAYASKQINETGRCVLGSHQPDFFPYMGYFYKMFQSDLWVFTDDVLFSKSGRHNYNEILTQSGPRKFTLPIHYHLENLNEIKIAADDKAIEKMLKTLWMEYRRAEYFHQVFPLLEEMIVEAPNCENLAVFNELCIMNIAHQFGLDREMITLVSSRDIPTEQKRDERIVWLCKSLNANVYFSGTGAKDYHIEQLYADSGVKLVYSDYQPVKYRQVGGREADNMSVIDYVLNCGFNLPRGWKRYE